MRDQPPYENEDSHEGSDDNQDATKGGGKRRSKNDNTGRDFKCKYCDKTYLSYPALYTHMKQKHSKGPDGELRNPPTSGRGRGRPRKNPHQRLDPRTEDFFKAPEREGGPVDPLCCFEKVYSQIFSQQKDPRTNKIAQSHEELSSNMYEYPVFTHLKQFSNQIDSDGKLKKISEPSPAEQDDKDEENGKDEEDKPQDESEEKPAGEHVPPTQFANKSKWNRNYDNLNDKDRQEMLVDEIFALYLYRMSNRINQSYYQTVLAYVIFFRECLNEYGWGKKIESEQIVLESNPEMKSQIENNLFCQVNNAEHAPEICNEFVTVYMEYKKSIYDIPKHDQIDLTINLCHWLFECQFTCSKLTMIA